MAKKISLINRQIKKHIDTEMLSFQTEPMVSLGINDNWAEYTLGFIENCKKRRATKAELFTRILKEISDTKVEIKFASAIFNL